MNNLMEKLEHAAKFVNKELPKMKKIRVISTFVFFASGLMLCVSEFAEGVNTGMKYVVDSVSSELENSQKNQTL